MNKIDNKQLATQPIIIRELSEFEFDIVGYGEYLDNWIAGIADEIEYWKTAVGIMSNNKNGDLQNRIFCKIPSLLEQYLVVPGMKVLEVGSGPFPCYSSAIGETKLNFRAVDPLAYEYSAIKKKNKITIGTTPEFAMVERLQDKFESNEFDIVYMRNALDHSYNPLVGIVQMLSVCNVGGKVILKHLVNVAEDANYAGLHQWNLCEDNSELLIWRPGIQYNVNSILSEYADFSFMQDSDSTMFTAVITKKQNIHTLPAQKTINRMLDEKIFEKLLEFIYGQVKNKKNPINIRIKRAMLRIPKLGDFAQRIYRKGRSS